MPRLGITRIKNCHLRQSTSTRHLWQRLSQHSSLMASPLVTRVVLTASRDRFFFNPCNPQVSALLQSISSKKVRLSFLFFNPSIFTYFTENSEAILLLKPLSSKHRLQNLSKTICYYEITKLIGMIYSVLFFLQRQLYAVLYIGIWPETALHHSIGTDMSMDFGLRSLKKVKSNLSFG
jgi:hypothetical protein